MHFPLFIPPRSRAHLLQWRPLSLLLMDQENPYFTLLHHPVLYNNDYGTRLYQHYQDNFENLLVSIIQHCPNLEIFIVEQPLKGAFGPVADALKIYDSRRLRTVHWNVTGDSLSKVIWALDSLPCLITAHIDIETLVPSDQECAMLGSASDLPLRLSNLQQLSLRSFITEFLEQCAGWDMPSAYFSIDSGISQ